MAHLPMLSVERRDIDKINKAIRQGDQDALREVQSLFIGEPLPFECFLCATEIAGSNYGIIFVPERKNPKKMIATVLCTPCYGLPAMVRLHRTFKMLKKMWPGTVFHFMR